MADLPEHFYGVAPIAVIDMNMSRVVITGIGMLTSRGCGLEQVWKACSVNHEQRQIEILSSWPVLPAKGLEGSKYNTPVFLRRRDRFTLFVIDVLEQAIHDAKLQAPLPEAGLVLESQLSSWNTVLKYTETLAKSGPNKVNPAMFTNVSSNAAQGQAAIQFGLKGPVSMMQGGGGFAYALRMIQESRVDQIFFSAAEEIVEPYLKSILENNNVYEDQKVYFSEGACSLLLESEESAINRGAVCYAEVIDAVICSDGSAAKSFLDCDIEGEAVQYAMHQLLNRSNINPEQVQAVFGMGNGTSVLDESERKAIEQVFGPYRDVTHFPTKQLIGETLGASGALQIGLASKSLYHGGTPLLTEHLNEKDFVIVNCWDVPGNICSVLLRAYNHG